MIKQLQSKQKKILKIIFKTGILLACYFFIIYKLTTSSNLDYFIEYLSDLDLIYFFILLEVLILMLVNWSIEAFKWKTILSKFEKIDFRTAILSVFQGVTFGIFTPNRVGELGGRLLILKNENRTKGLSAGILGSVSQLIIIFVFGIISSSLILNLLLKKSEQVNSGFAILIYCCIIIFTAFIIYSFFNLSKVFNFLKKFPFINKFEKHISFISEYTKNEIFKILNYSLFRYSIYILQYYLLLRFFGVDLTFFEAFTSISVTFFVVTLIPSIVLVDLGIRGSAALFFIGLFSTSEAGIISSAFCLWLINLVIPAIIGSVLIYKSKKN